MYKYAFALLAMLLLSGCKPSKPADTPSVEKAPTMASDHYAMPDMPPSVTTPTERANYVAAHYWERFPFADNPDSVFTEQAFVDYIAVLPMADADERKKGVTTLMGKLPQPDMLNRFMDLAAHYLGNPQSPMHSDDLYVDFLSAFVDLPGVDDTEKTRPRFLITNLKKNRVGEQATDFTYYDTRAQRRRTLSGTQADYLVLYFNDPDCESCQQEMPVAYAMATLRHPAVGVLLVNTEKEQGVGAINDQPLPDNWIDGYDPGQAITARQLYFLPAMPSLYLLDSQKRVILKDASLEDIERYLAEHL